MLDITPATRQTGYLDRTIGDVLDCGDQYIIQAYVADGPLAGETIDMLGSMTEFGMEDIKTNCKALNSLVYDRLEIASSYYCGTAFHIMLAQDYLFCTDSVSEDDLSEVPPRVCLMATPEPNKEESLLDWLRWRVMGEGLRTEDTMDEWEELEVARELTVKEAMEIILELNEERCEDS